MPHVHLYLRHFPGAGEGLNDGTVKAVHGLASGIAQCGRSVTVLCEGDEAHRRRSPSGYDIACFSNRRRFPPGRLSDELKQYVLDRRRDILVVLNGVFHPSVSAMSRWLRTNGVPYVAAPHDPYHPSIFRTNAHLKWPYWYLRERPMLRRAAAVQVLDGRHGQFLRDLNVRTEVIEAPNGFLSAEVPPQESLQWRDGRAPRLVFMGRLDAYNKGLDLLLEAFSRLPLSATLAVRGPDAGDADSLRDRAKALGVAGRVDFTGPDFKRAGPSILADYDVFCLPSRFEGFGLAALEAMLAGRPVLVSDVAGIAPHVRASGCGVVVEPDVASIDAGIQRLLARRDEWHDIGLRGRAYALKHLRWDRIASGALERYARLAG